MKQIALIFLSLLPVIGSTDLTEWDGNYYANHSQLQFEIALAALEKLSISPSAHILDIGCGDGRITEHLSKLIPNGSVIGMDLSPSMLEKAAPRKTENLSFVLADATKIPFSEQFECIVSFNCLHWVKEIQSALQGVYTSLAPKGQALFLVAPIQQRYPIHRIINGVAHKEPWCNYFEKAPSLFDLYTFSEWTVLCERSGFLIESCQFVPLQLNFPNTAAFGGWLAGWIPFGTMPVNKREAFIREIAEAYPVESDGTVHFLMDELLIQCTKI